MKATLLDRMWEAFKHYDWKEKRAGQEVFEDEDLENIVRGYCTLNEIHLCRMYNISLDTLAIWTHKLVEFLYEPEATPDGRASYRFRSLRYIDGRDLDRERKVLNAVYDILLRMPPLRSLKNGRRDERDPFPFCNGYYLDVVIGTWLQGLATYISYDEDELDKEERIEVATSEDFEEESDSSSPDLGPEPEHPESDGLDKDSDESHIRYAKRQIWWRRKIVGEFQQRVRRFNVWGQAAIPSPLFWVMMVEGRQEQWRNAEAWTRDVPRNPFLDDI